jgi:hypothetical protein
MKTHIKGPRAILEEKLATLSTAIESIDNKRETWRSLATAAASAARALENDPHSELQEFSWRELAQILRALEAAADEAATEPDPREDPVWQRAERMLTQGVVEKIELTPKGMGIHCIARMGEGVVFSGTSGFLGESLYKALQELHELAEKVKKQW